MTEQSEGFQEQPVPEDLVIPPAAPEPEDPNEYAYVVNKFQRPPGTTTWNHMSVSDYLPFDEAIDWIERGGPRS